MDIVHTQYEILPWRIFLAAAEAAPYDKIQNNSELVICASVVSGRHKLCKS